MTPADISIFMNDPWWIVLIKVVGVVVLLLTWTIFNVWYERRLVGKMQHRLGPIMNGPLGLGQALAFFHFLPLFTPQIKFKTGLAILALISVIIVAGHINAITINIKQIPLTIRKSGSDGKPIKILMASDIHLGALIGERREEKLLKIVREQKPDLVLLCGDHVDGHRCSRPARTSRKGALRL